MLNYNRSPLLYGLCYCGIGINLGSDTAGCYNTAYKAIQKQKKFKFRAGSGLTMDVVYHGATTLLRIIQEQKQGKSRTGADFGCDWSNNLAKDYEFIRNNSLPRQCKFRSRSVLTLSLASSARDLVLKLLGDCDTPHPTFVKYVPQDLPSNAIKLKLGVAPHSR